MPHPLDPTPAQYSAFAQAFGHFNEQLFGDRLPQPMLTFSRRKMVNGTFTAGSWRGEAGEAVDEISLNPDQLSARTAVAVASTLVHEMCHQYQEHHGTPSRTSYHNQEFAELMEARGLRTSHDGTPTGRRTGQRMTHVIAAGGPFEVAFGRLGRAALLPFTCLTSEEWSPRRRPKRDRSKTKYQAPGVRKGLWGAPGLVVVDGVTGELFEAEGDPEAAVAAVGESKARLYQWVAQLDEEACRQMVEALEAEGVIL